MTTTRAEQKAAEKAAKKAEQEFFENAVDHRLVVGDAFAAEMGWEVGGNRHFMCMRWFVKNYKDLNGPAPEMPMELIIKIDQGVKVEGLSF